ncbi:uncharacterized protein MONBRDRAFT_33431, partial [Monosiga brevicollis MX1]
MAPLDDYDLDPFRAANLTTIQDGFLLGLVQTDSGDLRFLAQPLIDEQGRPNSNGILIRHELPYSNGVPSFQSQHAALSPDLCAVIVHTAFGYRLLVWALAANTTIMVGEPQDLGEVSPAAHVVARGNKMLYQTIDGTVYVATVSRTSASPSASVLAPVSIYNAQQSALLTLSNDWLAISHGKDGSRSITLMIPHTVDQSGAPVLIMANATQLLQAYTPTAVGLLNFTAVLSYPCTTTVVTYCRHSAYSRECNVMSPNTCPTPTTTITTTAAAATVVSTESTSSVAPTASPSTLTAGELVPDRSSHVLAWALAGSLASFVLGALVVYQLSRRRRRRKLQYLYLASEDPSDKFTELHPDDSASTCGLEEKNASAGQGPSMYALEADLECRETQLYTQSAIQAFLQGEEVEALQIVHSSRGILEADELGRNILTLACLHNSDWLVFELTQHPQFDNLVKQYDQRGYTAFHWAILVSSYEIIERLLQVKYDLLMVPTLDGNLALHLLIRENRHEILRRLLDFKRRLLRLQILEEDENGLMPLERCDHYGADECRSLLQSVYDETVDTSKPLSANRTRFKRAIIMRLQRLRGGHQTSPVLVNAQAIYLNTTRMFLVCSSWRFLNPGQGMRKGSRVKALSVPNDESLPPSQNLSLSESLSQNLSLSLSSSDDVTRFVSCAQAILDSHVSSEVVKGKRVLSQAPVVSSSLPPPVSSAPLTPLLLVPPRPYPCLVASQPPRARPPRVRRDVSAHASPMVLASLGIHSAAASWCFLNDTMALVQPTAHTNLSTWFPNATTWPASAHYNSSLNEPFTESWAVIQPNQPPALVTFPPNMTVVHCEDMQILLRNISNPMDLALVYFDEDIPPQPLPGLRTCNAPPLSLRISNQELVLTFPTQSSVRVRTMLTADALQPSSNCSGGVDLAGDPLLDSSHFVATHGAYALVTTNPKLPNLAKLWIRTFPNAVQPVQAILAIDGNVALSHHYLAFHRHDNAIVVLNTSNVNANGYISQFSTLKLQNELVISLAISHDTLLVAVYEPDGNHRILVIPHKNAVLDIKAKTEIDLDNYRPQLVGFLNKDILIAFECNFSLVQSYNAWVYTSTTWTTVLKNNCIQLSPTTRPQPSTTSMIPTTPAHHSKSLFLAKLSSTEIIAVAVVVGAISFMLGLWLALRYKRRRKLLTASMFEDAPPLLKDYKADGDAINASGAHDKSQVLAQADSFSYASPPISAVSSPHSDAQLIAALHNPDHHTLAIALAEGDEDMALCLIAAGVDVTADDDLGRNALMLSCIYNCGAVVRRLTLHPLFDDLLQSHRSFHGYA